jgi:NAD(P)-dependent dehydrogenase (short-subunit alcohol dehydrogenase family)
MTVPAFDFEPFWGHGRPLAGRTALVTGAGRGIGRGVAEELSAAGAEVVAADLDPVTAQQTIELLDGPGRAAGVDVADPDSVERLVASLTGAGTRIDVLVNVAGVLSICAVADLAAAEWDRIMALTTPRREGRGFRPSRVGVPVSLRSAREEVPGRV